MLVRELTGRPSRRGASIVPIDSGAVRRLDCQVPLGSCLPIRVIAATLPAIVLAVYLANTAILQLWLTTTA